MESLRETLPTRGRFDGLFMCSHRFLGVRTPISSKFFFCFREINKNRMVHGQGCKAVSIKEAMKIGFIGGGKLAFALANGFISAGNYYLQHTKYKYSNTIQAYIYSTRITELMSTLAFLCLLYTCSGEIEHLFINRYCSDFSDLK
ncbi:hypothetical protein EVAR_6353_1 [Eumeta japonica]|uniref:Uncharacterized protein n=1 Tax=Eumeta variegata TaxID=151549 RepID=A0A4C1TCB9_EUMVA|nr:hypothetical protein EVAR_6353_1 [Eumeta japonica]